MKNPMERPVTEAYLPETDPEYMETMERKKKDARPKAYGEADVERYHEFRALQARGETKHWGGPIAEKLEGLFEFPRRILARELDDSVWEHRAKGFLQQAIHEPETGPELSALIATDGILDQEKAKAFLNDFKNHTELWVRVLERHRAGWLVRVEAKQEEIAQARKEFVEAAKREIAAGTLAVSEELLLRRVEETEIHVRDAMENPGIGGYENQSIFIADILEEGVTVDTKHIVYHELLHALSGRIIGKQRQGSFSPQIEHLKIGIGIRTRPSETNQFPHVKFDWLNEALTERKILQMIGLPGDGAGGYAIERAALGILLKRGLGEQTLYNAYFENYDPETRGLPAWKALMDAIGADQDVHDRIETWNQQFGGHL